MKLTLKAENKRLAAELAENKAELAAKIVTIANLGKELLRFDLLVEELRKENKQLFQLAVKNSILIREMVAREDDFGRWKEICAEIPK